MGSPAALHDFLAGQRQLRLERAGVARLFRRLEDAGLVTGSDPDGPGPARLTSAGEAEFARLSALVAPVTGRLYAGFDPAELATAHRVLAQVVQRAGQLRDEISTG
jgi:DNA-binding MarR family transcriptional regulator